VTSRAPQRAQAERARERGHRPGEEHAVRAEPRTGCGCSGRRLRTTWNWGVFTAGRCTAMTFTRLRSCASSHRSESAKPRTAAFAAQYALCSGIER
jgi:hypothetical protein